MMPGTSYDDSYITRKLSQMPGPTFTAPGRPTYLQGYPPLGPPPRMLHRIPPSYYDYDYGYGGYYGYVPPPVRMSRYDSYLDDDLLDHTYIPRYRPRVADTLDDADYREKAAGVRAVRAGEGEARRSALQSLPGQDIAPGETQGERHLARLAHRYPSLSEPQMLQDHVDKMRIRLKSLAYSLDPSGPVPEIIVPDRPRKSSAAVTEDKKYSSGPRHLACVEFAGGQPLWRRKARARLPSDDPHHLAALTKAEFLDPQPAPEKEKEKLIIKDRLSNRIHQFFNSTLNAEQFQKYLKTYREPGPKPPMMPDSSRYSKYSSTKWEEPDTVFGAPSDKKPFSKDEGGSAAAAEGGSAAAAEGVQAVTDGTTEEASEEKKERRKKKKSKERDIVAEIAAAEAAPVSAPPPSDLSTSEVEAVSAPSESEPAPASTEIPAEEEVLDEKERKRLEKKKRKAEREAAAKAAMEAELAALAAAEAELARLEAESSALKPEVPAPEVVAPAEVVAAPAEAAVPPSEPAAEVKSESAAEK